MSKFLKFKKVNTLKLAYISSMVFFILALCIFLIRAIISLIFQGQIFGFISVLIISVLIMPVVYGIVGFISGWVLGILYNLVSKCVGSLEFEVEEIEKFND